MPLCFLTNAWWWLSFLFLRWIHPGGLRCHWDQAEPPLGQHRLQDLRRGPRRQTEPQGVHRSHEGPPAPRRRGETPSMFLPKPKRDTLLPRGAAGGVFATGSRRHRLDVDLRFYCHLLGQNVITSCSLTLISHVFRALKRRRSSSPSNPAWRRRCQANRWEKCSHFATFIQTKQWK